MWAAGGWEMVSAVAVERWLLLLLLQLLPPPLLRCTGAAAAVQYLQLLAVGLFGQQAL